MENKILKVAKELFFTYGGSKYQMAREEVVHKYMSYNIPKEIELQWLNEMFDKDYSQLNINDIDSLLNISSFITMHTEFVLNKLYLVEKYIDENLSRCMNTKGVIILVLSILENLRKVSKIDVRQEIAVFERLMKKIRIRKIKLMIWNCMNPVFVIRSIYNWIKTNYIDPISVRIKRRLKWGSKNSRKRKIMDSKVSKAKELFWSHNGYQNQMIQDGTAYILSQYHIPHQIEKEWAEELFNEKLEQLNFTDINKINDLILFMQVHLKWHLKKLRVIKKLILKNKDNDAVRKEMIILIDAILTTLNYIENRNVKRKIATFEKLKKLISKEK